MFLENSRKVGLIVESNRVCHLGDIYLLIAYQACCLFQSDIADKLTGRETSHLLHLAVQLGPADTYALGERLYAEVGIRQVFVDAL